MIAEASLPPNATTFASNLPAGVTSFLGREDQLMELAESFDRSRLVTLTGAPGIGKSRLGLELARRLAEYYPGGAWLAELAAADDGDEVCSVLATALSLPDAPGRSPTDRLVRRLRDQKALLVLDNCEHVVKPTAELADALLAGCPDLSIIATSREPLAIGGEAIHQVPPLAVPPPDPAELEVLRDYEAVALFVERAAAVQPAFALNRYVAPRVAEICRRLDGLPLAIELAAALSAMLTPAEIVRRLDDRFGLLIRGSRSELPRHQTLAAAVDWSHELLDPAERVLLRRLSVFTGGFCLEACEAVCAGWEVDSGDAFELLARLVSRSLVVADTVNGPRSRYRLLETIRAYASDRLEDASEAAKMREAHARFFLGLAEEAEGELEGPDQVEWFERLETERANLRAALEWSMGHGRTEWALRLAGGLILFWRVRCHFKEGRRLLDDAITASNGVDPSLKAKALWGLGFMTHMAGDHEDAIVPLKESLTRFSDLDDLQGRARALLLLGHCGRFIGDPQDALPPLEESAALAREAGDAWCLAHALCGAGFVRIGREEFAAARPLYEEAIEAARAAGDKQGLRYAAYGLGALDRARGDLDSAERLLEEAVELSDELGDNQIKAGALQHLADVAIGRDDLARASELLDAAVATDRQLGASGPSAMLLVLRAQVAQSQKEFKLAGQLLEQAAAPASTPPEERMVAQYRGVQAAIEGDFDGARRLWEKALCMARAEGYKRGIAHASDCLGHLARFEGDRKRAAALFNEALQLQSQIGNLAGVVSSLEAVGGLAVESDRGEHAVRLFAAADASRRANGFKLSDHEADLAQVRESLSDEDFEQAWRQGRSLSLAEAVGQASKGRGARTRAGSGWPSLTDSERQVAALVAEGLTNPEIAERMFVSLGTVKAHLSHIFQKLGIAKRRELSREVMNRAQDPSDPD